MEGCGGGCVNGAGRLGIDAGPDGGARFIAGPAGASGTDAGGTGGGRSVNICAETEAGIARTGSTRTSAAASTIAASGRPLRPDSLVPLLPIVMMDAFSLKTRQIHASMTTDGIRGTGRERGFYRWESRCPPQS